MRTLFILSLMLGCKGSDNGYTQALKPGYVRVSMSTSVYYQCNDWEFEDQSIYLYCTRTSEADEEENLEVDLLQEGGSFDGVLDYEQSDIGGSIHLAGGEAAGCTGACGSDASEESKAATCDVGIDGETLGIISCGNTPTGGESENAEDEEGTPAANDGGFIIDWGMAVQLMPSVHDDLVESFE